MSENVNATDAKLREASSIEPPAPQPDAAVQAAREAVCDAIDFVLHEHPDDERISAALDALIAAATASAGVAAERAAKLEAAILDIDAHATPYGDNPNDPGYVLLYLLTAGALHRALGVIGRSAVKAELSPEVRAALGGQS